MACLVWMGLDSSTGTPLVALDCDGCFGCIWGVVNQMVMFGVNLPVLPCLPEVRGGVTYRRYSHHRRHRRCMTEESDVSWRRPRRPRLIADSVEMCRTCMSFVQYLHRWSGCCPVRNLPTGQQSCTGGLPGHGKAPQTLSKTSRGLCAVLRPGARENDAAATGGPLLLVLWRSWSQQLASVRPTVGLAASARSQERQRGSRSAPMLSQSGTRFGCVFSWRGLAVCVLVRAPILLCSLVFSFPLVIG